MCAFEVLTFYASLALVMFAIVLLGLVSSASSPEIKKGSPYSITERRVPELIPVLGSQPVGCHQFLPGLQLPPQPLRGLLPILMLGDQRHDGCEQFA